MSEKTDKKTNENANESDNAGFFDHPGNVRLVLRIFYAACRTVETHALPHSSVR